MERKEFIRKSFLATMVGTAVPAMFKAKNVSNVHDTLIIYLNVCFFLNYEA